MRPIPSAFAALCAAFLPLWALADTAAQTVQNIGPSLAPSFGTYGWAFQAIQPFRITALGAWDVGTDGFTIAHDLYLWRADQTQLAHITIGPGVSGTVLSQSYRFLPLSTPIEVAAGEQFVIGGGWGSSNLDFFPGQTSNIFDPAVRFMGGRSTSTTNAFPYQPEPNYATDAVNFMLQPVPTPGTLAIAPLAFAGFARRRRRRA